MWIWDDRLQEWIWIRKPGGFGPLQVILMILVVIFLVLILFPGKIDEFIKNRNLLPPIPPQATQPVYQQAPQQIIIPGPQQPVLVITETARFADVTIMPRQVITPDVNPAWQGPIPTAQPLPQPLGPPLPPGWGNPYP